MPKKSKGPVEGHHYRFNLGTESSAADVMFSVWLPGPIDEAAAVGKAKDNATEMQDGIDLRCFEGGRIYFHPKLITCHMIADISPDAR